MGGHCSCHEVGVNTMPLPFHWTSKRRLCLAMGARMGIGMRVRMSGASWG